MPKIKIGFRLIKTSIAVFICLVIDCFRGGAFPFYSVIAAVLCMQKDIESSKTVSINRMIGTLIGGTYGLLILLLLRNLIPNIHELLQYLIISISIIPLIYFTVSIKKPASSYITCVVFFSVVIAHNGEDISPFMFAIHRITDTFIGILVSLFVNMIPFMKTKPSSNEQIQTLSKSTKTGT